MIKIKFCKEIDGCMQGNSVEIDIDDFYKYWVFDFNTMKFLVKPHNYINLAWEEMNK